MTALEHMEELAQKRPAALGVLRRETKNAIEFLIPASHGEDEMYLLVLEFSRATGSWMGAYTEKGVPL